MTKIFVWPLITFLIFSCAKTPEYDTVYKVAEQTNRFSDYDTDSIYVYVPSTLDTPRNVAVKMPFYQDEELLVKLKWTKEGLSVFAPDDDYRFDFSRNQRPIFTIPGDYRAYRCAKNNIGECTNREEVDYDTPWNKRAFFDPDLEQINFSSSLTTMDIYHDDGCVIHKNTRLKDYLIKKGIINIELEREFRISSSDACLSKYLKFDNSKINTQDFSFKTTYFYSLVRLKDLASPDYEKFQYPLVDQDRFGYFLRLRKTLDENFRRSKKEYLLNRWNPDRKFLTYHLSDSFNMPGMEIFKDATYKAVEDINKTLESAGITFKVKLEEPSGKKSGDLRYNMIVLITDPLRSGLLGYAPTVSNPLTGEIIQGHINMYSGVTTQIAPIIYGHMVRLSYKEAQINFKGGESDVFVAGEVGNAEEGRALLRSQIGFSPPTKTILEDPNLKLNPDYWSASSSLSPPKELKFKNDLSDRLDFFAKHNAYPQELFLSGGFQKSYMPGIKEIKDLWHENKTLKKWEDLTVNQKKKVTNIIVPLVYRYTFVHEFGHGLGLRHNFMGSVDKKHFYEKEEVPLGGIIKSGDGDEDLVAPQFSSIMDYGYSSLNDLPIFGKYDIAALRYGYARKVEIEKSGEKELVPLGKKGIKLYHIPHLVKYEFCTDGHVRANTLCNRFDEGTSYTEIMSHYKEKYDSDFYQANFRNENTNFTIYENVNYFWWRYMEFSRIRNIFDSWETYFAADINQSGVAKNIDARRDAALNKVKRCEGDDGSFCEKIRDLHKASTIAGKFFLDIIKTPEHTCLFSLGPKLVQIELRALHSDFRLIKAPKSCFDKEVISEFKKRGFTGYKVIGERGKFLTDTRENDSRYPYGSDISARGVWIDKVLAMQYLFGRNLPSHKVEDPELNFRDHPIIGPLLDDLVRKMFDQSEVTQMDPFVDKMGKVLKGPGIDGLIPLRFNYTDNPEIRPQVSKLLNYFLDLPWRSSFYLSRPMITSAENYLQTTSPKINWLAKMDRDFFRVKKIGDHVTLNENLYPQSFNGEDGHIYAGAFRNELAFNLIRSINIKNFLELNPQLISYQEKQAKIGKPISAHKLLKEIYGRKNNPYIPHVDRTEALGTPIETRINAYFKGMAPELQKLGSSGGGIVLKKIIDMKAGNDKIEEKDFIEAFGPQGGAYYYSLYEKLTINEIKQAFEKIGVDINLIHMSLTEIKRTNQLAMMMEKEGNTQALETFFLPDEKFSDIKKFIISNAKSTKIMEIHDWLLSTAEMPVNFELDEIYKWDLDFLKTIYDNLEFKNREELEYTLKNLPSY